MSFNYAAKKKTPFQARACRLGDPPGRIGGR